ncbi:hypothetical protein GO491_06100 [Flavobacteriaceae bacterium Ap0902]|nr:hypothetical protein [Flavobacteriaceae bacterium Ap0902]
MRIPKHLKHKPILGVDNCESIDGKYAGKSDAKAISIGKAQWDNEEISAKVFRHTGKRWSRQNEEYEKIKNYIKDNAYLEERIRELENTLKKIQK